MNVWTLWQHNIEYFSNSYTVFVMWNNYHKMSLCFQRFSVNSTQIDSIFAFKKKGCTFELLIKMLFYTRSMTKVFFELICLTHFLMGHIFKWNFWKVLISLCSIMLLGRKNLFYSLGTLSRFSFQDMKVLNEMLCTHFFLNKTILYINVYFT